ncbi:MAG: sugar phosphate isomerase/epimerase family protein, partial [Spirochaetota bacterium]
FEQGKALNIKFELDTYWVVAGGADPAEYIERFSEYMSIVHVKDMIVTGDREQRFAPVGSGNLNWRRVFDAIRSAPIEFVIVEQDAHYDDDPIENVAKSFSFLKENGFAVE